MDIENNKVSKQQYIIKEGKRGRRANRMVESGGD